MFGFFPKVSQVATKFLLQPLGDHRKTHIHPSKGKSRKRKRKQQQPQPSSSEANNIQHEESTDTNSTNPPPPPPEIKTHILIGLNSITRHLEALVAQNTQNLHEHSSKENNQEKLDQKKETKPINDTKEKDQQEKQQNPAPLLRRISILVLPHPNPSLSLAHAHIPPLIQLSTLSTPPLPSSPQPANSDQTQKTYTIPLPTTAEAALASALHIPRVGALAILDGAPGAEALVEYVKGNVGDDGVVECKWVAEAMGAAWRGVKIVS
ncbi:hypothetical protein DM02DRAFT_673424 [Periconia macrospinosa]|uniref:Uncharacterized protein n=1 Tax=Periconia macrospinosa TaxID=97972 RepID=A0A2V1DJQ7_9PLEO|nr:hypothetical protein DM02DRAFT_673424 [Periconia macrospinosa]